MTLIHTARFTGRRSGTYIAIFASTYVSLFLAALIAEQMGMPAASLSRWLLLAVAALFVESVLAVCGFLDNWIPLRPRLAALAAKGKGGAG